MYFVIYMTSFPDDRILSGLLTDTGTGLYRGRAHTSHSNNVSGLRLSCSL